MKAGKIKCIIFDVDGVLTAGSIIYGTEDEIKEFNVQDGMGITLAREAGLYTGIITGRRSACVRRRAEELKFDYCFQGDSDKRAAYSKIKSELNLQDSEIAYMGDDLLDLCLLLQAGFSVAPANARDEVKESVDYVTVASGGCGAVREAVEYILKEQGLWSDIVKKYKTV